MHGSKKFYQKIKNKIEKRYNKKLRTTQGEREHKKLGGYG